MRIGISEFTDLTFLTAARHIIDLPLQCPVFDIPDHIDQLDPALGKRIFGSDRDHRCIDSFRDDLLCFQLLQTFREHLCGYIRETLLEF